MTTVGEAAKASRLIIYIFPVSSTREVSSILSVQAQKAVESRKLQQKASEFDALLQISL
jgi:hypothetical protein